MNKTIAVLLLVSYNCVAETRSPVLDIVDAYAKYPQVVYVQQYNRYPQITNVQIARGNPKLDTEPVDLFGGARLHETPSIDLNGDTNEQTW
jgi:hypothetical protein